MLSRFLITPYISYLKERLSEADGSISLFGFKIDSPSKLIVTQTAITGTLIWITVLAEPNSNRIFLYTGMAGLGLYAPIVVLNRRIKRRREIVVNELPGIMEVMAMIMEAGLSFDAAVKYVAESKKGHIASLFLRARAEIDAGIKREQAYGKIAGSSLSELNLFISAVVNAEDQGRPLKRIILDMAASFRERQQNSLEEAANRLPTTMLIPIFVFIVPPMILIYLLPAITNLADVVK